MPEPGLFFQAADAEPVERGPRLVWAAAGLALVAVPLVVAFILLGGGREIAAPSLRVVIVTPAASPQSPPAAPAVVAAATPAQPAWWFDRTRAAVVAPHATNAFMPVYHEAARRFHVSWLLLASIHRQETAFSSSPGTYRGLNFAHCCAGPMQFNVRNRPISTWRLFRSAYRYGIRPPSYPHRTSFHPSVYDDFDAIMAAAWLLRASGATTALDGTAWQAAYDYYGHDGFGTVYADQVLARAQRWHVVGFNPNADASQTVVDRLDSLYGAPARAALPKPKPKAKGKARHKKTAPQPLAEVARKR